MWTTTPWTLVSNAAVAVKPDLTYVRARAANADPGAPAQVVAQALVEKVLGEDAEVLDTFLGAELIGTHYEAPFPYIPAEAYGPKGHTVLPADFVTAEDGTGLVHTAIAFGEDDFRLGEVEGLNVVNPVRLDGTYDERIGPYAGRNVKAADPTSSRTCAPAAGCCAPRPTSTPIRTAGAAARRCCTTPSPPGTSPPARSRTSCWRPTRPSTGTPTTSSTAASATGWRATSTGRCRASATGARRCRCGAATTAARG